jgi:hypothetical protein
MAPAMIGAPALGAERVGPERKASRMTTDVLATMLLCDAAQVVSGKLYMLGGGWTRVSAPNRPINMSLAIIVHVPWSLANERMKIEVGLRDDDGDAVLVGDRPITSAGTIEVGRPAGLKAGERINVPMAMNFNNIRLGPGGYVWECLIEDRSVARWPFRVSEPPRAGA